MKFLRHLAVVTLLIAVVVGLGLAWNKFMPSTLLGYQPVAGPVQFNGPLPGQHVVLRPGLRARAHPGKLRLPGRRGGFIAVQPGPSVLSTFANPANWRQLRRPVLIELLLLSAVVIIDVVRRRLRRLSKAREAD